MASNEMKWDFLQMSELKHFSIGKTEKSELNKLFDSIFDAI